MTEFNPRRSIRLAEAATPGPWERRDTTIGRDNYHANTEIVGRVQSGGSTPVAKLAAGFVWFEGDCDFIPDARTALPEACRRLIRLRELLWEHYAGTTVPAEIVELLTWEETNDG